MVEDTDIDNDDNLNLILLCQYSALSIVQQTCNVLFEKQNEHLQETNHVSAVKQSDPVGVDSIRKQGFVCNNQHHHYEIEWAGHCPTCGETK
jgi:hypothetical protein